MWSAVGRRGVALEQKETRLPLLGTRFCLRRAGGEPAGYESAPLRSARGACWRHPAPEARWR
jgi:hypothetical protein